MSRVPMGSNLGDAGWSGFSDKLLEQWQIVPQGISAEAIAEKWGLSREALDAYSYESHVRAVRAIDEGRFEREIVPVEVSNPHAGVLFAVDETPRRDTSPEKLAALHSCVQGGRCRDGRELEPDRRRSGRDARRERAASVRARPRAACQVRLVRARRRRPVPDAARQPAGQRAGAREGGADVGRHRGDRGQRGVRVGRPPVPEGHGAAAIGSRT